ncbi:MAG TPA: ABC transporter ATP-binding protein, partial [Pyrinomonadaceae bacterium]|nr:ABC transporter ATP-binding protein [Pyrinomonadaceae bacterium]
MQAKRSGEFSWLLSQVKPFFRLHLGSYFCVVAAGILVLLDPLIIRFLIDEVIPGRRISWLPFVAAAFFFTYLGRLGFDSLAGILNFRAVQKMTHRSRLALLRHLQRLSAEYHDNTSPGDTLHRLQMDVDQVATLSGEVLPALLRMFTTLTLVICTMLVLNYRLTIVVLPLIPVFILVRRRFQSRLRSASDSVQERSGKLIGFLEEHLSSIVQV